MSTMYRVYITPKTGLMTYGDEVEITNYVKEAGVSAIRRGIDSTDYDFGVYFYDDILLSCLNVNGFFNDENDLRSMFQFTRDRARVRVVFTDSDGTDITFEGLINEEATRIEATDDEIIFRVLSLASVIRNVQVPSGLITPGSLVSSALNSILNLSEITAVLNFDPININPDFDFTIDDPAELEQRSVKESLDQLLRDSNSVMLIDEDDNIIVRNRDEINTTEVLNLYGPYDLKRRQNIVDINKMNLGRHRLFTAVKVNETESVNNAYKETFGYRLKKISAAYITDPDTENAVAANLVDAFKAPKIELEVTVPTRIARSAKPLDRVSINHPLRVSPPAGKFLPIIGSAIIGDDETPLPNTYGSVYITPDMSFKILEIKDDPKNFLTTLKLRQIGNEIGDGYFGVGLCGVVGFAIIGVHEVCETGELAAAFNPSVVGAAVVGYTELEA